jgi:hypothetical protein
MKLSDSNIRFRIVGARVFALAVVGYALWETATAPGTSSPLFAVGFGLVLVGLTEALLALSWLIQRHRYAVPVRYEVTSEGAVVHTARGTESLEWARVARVHRGRHGWTVKREGGLTAFMIPRAAFTDAESRTINEFFLAHPEFAG